MNSRYYIIKNHKEVKKLVKACLSTGYCCYDFETNAEPIYTNKFKPTLLSISFQPGSGIAIPLDHFETKDYCDQGYNWRKELIYVGRKLFENDNPKLTKIGHNIKFDNQVWLRLGIRPIGRMLDSMLAKYVLNEERPHDLKELVCKYLPDFGGYEKASGLDKLPWDKKPLDPLSKYGCLDVDCTLRLMLFFEKKLIDNGFYNVYRNLFMCNSIVLTQVERNGLYLDREFNKKLLDDYLPKIEAAKEAIYNLPKVKKFAKYYQNIKIEKYLESIENEIDELDADDPKNSRKIQSRQQKIASIRAGIFTTKKELELIRPINLGSPVDLPQLMYSKKGFNFPVVKYTTDSKTGKESDKPSTDEETLNTLRLQIEDPESPKAIFLDNMLSLRGLEKMYKTYILGWSEKVQDDSRLHGRYNIHGTDSNRFSSADPNMQQIPKTTVDPNIKKQLVAPPGKLYMAFDYSQAELRMMAHLSGDEAYLQAFRDGKDPHLMIAAKKYNTPIEEATVMYEDENHPEHKVWKVRRKQAKQIAFGLIYGIGPTLLAQKLSDPKAGIIVSKEGAIKEMDEFFKQHPKIKKFKEKQEKYVRKHGYYKQLFGTKRRLPQIYSDDQGEVAYAIRLGLNFPCQGAAANMTNFGAILIYYLMRQGKLPMMDEVATVHDAIYENTIPENINVWTVYTIWDILRNPSTKEYFDFQVDDVDMDMDFTIGRSMAEELPFVPLYDYSKMLQPDFNVDEYMEEHKKYKHIHVKDFPKYFAKEMEECKQKFISRRII